MGLPPSSSLSTTSPEIQARREWEDHRKWARDPCRPGSACDSTSPMAGEARGGLDREPRSSLAHLADDRPRANVFGPPSTPPRPASVKPIRAPGGPGRRRTISHLAVANDGPRWTGGVMGVCGVGRRPSVTVRGNSRCLKRAGPPPAPSLARSKQRNRTASCAFDSPLADSPSQLAIDHPRRRAPTMGFEPARRGGREGPRWCALKRSCRMASPAVVRITFQYGPAISSRKPTIGGIGGPHRGGDRRDRRCLESADAAKVLTIAHRDASRGNHPLQSGAIGSISSSMMAFVEMVEIVGWARQGH